MQTASGFLRSVSAVWNASSDFCGGCLRLLKNIYNAIINFTHPLPFRFPNPNLHSLKGRQFVPMPQTFYDIGFVSPRGECLKCEG